MSGTIHLIFQEGMHKYTLCNLFLKGTYSVSAINHTELACTQITSHTITQSQTNVAHIKKIMSVFFHLFQSVWLYILYKSIVKSALLVVRVYMLPLPFKNFCEEFCGPSACTENIIKNICLVSACTAKILYENDSRYSCRITCCTQS